MSEIIATSSGVMNQLMASLLAWLHLMGFSDNDITGLLLLFMCATVFFIAQAITGHGRGRSGK